MRPRTHATPVSIRACRGESRKRDADKILKCGQSRPSGRRGDRADRMIAPVKRTLAVQ